MARYFAETFYVGPHSSLSFTLMILCKENVECRTPNAERRMPNAEFRAPNAKQTLENNSWHDNNKSKVNLK